VTNRKIKTQAFDCMQYFYGAVQEPRIRCLIRVQGRIDESVLKRAVNLSVKAVPLIGCVFDEKRHCWREYPSIAEEIVHVIEAAEESENPALKYLLASLDHTREPQLKILLVREKERDTLCVIINHMLSDGAGFKEYLYLLGELYSKCEKDAGYDKKPETPGRRDLNQLLQNLSLREKLSILFSRMDSNRPDPAMIIPTKGNSANPIIVITRIEKEQFGAVRSFAGDRGASVNDVLLTAYVRALRRETGCGTITVPCPVDLRKYRRENQRCGICNLTGNYWCTVEIPAGEAFGDTLRKVSDQMQAQKTSGECLKEPMQFHILYHTLPFKTVRKIFYRVSSIPVTSYTNLGVLDERRLRFGENIVDDAFISTAVKKVPYFQLSISTYKGRCTLTSSMFGTEEDRTVINGVFNRIINELKNSLPA